MWYVARMASPYSKEAGTRTWSSVWWVCPSTVKKPDDPPDKRYRQFGSLTIEVHENLNGYVTGEGERDKEQVMTICPAYHEVFMRKVVKSISDGLDITRLHVPRGKNPTAYQKAALETMQRQRFTIEWLGKGLVPTLIHELTHARAFTPPGRTLSKSTIITPTVIYADASRYNRRH